MTDLILARALRFALLTDAHKARKAHRSTSGIMARLREVTKTIIKLEA